MKISRQFPNALHVQCMTEISDWAPLSTMRNRQRPENDLFTNMKRMSKHSAIFLVAVLINVFTASVFGQTFGSGTGAASDPYLISSDTDWKTLTNAVNSGNTFTGKYFLLTQSLNGINTVIGDSETHAFSGVFDGGGHAIEVQIKIYATEVCYSGVFGVLKNAIIKNLYVRGTVSAISTHSVFAGGICGYAANSVLYNCSLMGNVSATSLSRELAYSGGICGHAVSGATISDGYFTGWLSSDSHSFGTSVTGGICGLLESSTISNCMVTKSDMSCSNGGRIVGVIKNGQTDHCYAWMTLVNGYPRNDKVSLSKDGTTFTFPLEIKTLPHVNTSVEFSTSDTFLLNLYQAAERVEQGNVNNKTGRNVLVEGGGYSDIWIETQPMGGEMYAKHNIETAMNNVLYFMEYQNPSGQYACMIRLREAPYPEYASLQGFCFPYHALNLYYWNKKKDTGYLQALYRSIELFDRYLWRYRDTDGDGCLETWCETDTGEDHSNRFHGSHISYRWEGEKPPTEDPVFPIESMDVMSYSYDARATLAKISALLNNGLEKEWIAKAKDVQDKIKSYLWDDKRGACYDRNNKNEFMEALQHNNLRAMYFNSFTQPMADRFVKEHLLNPEEFFTPFPLPSIAVNNPVFRNVQQNNWGGQPMGLTYQRTIRALENYGYYAEITTFGTKLIDNVGKRNTFPQQFDPFTGEFSEADLRISYGPSALAVLEYISRLYGIHVQFDEIYWGALGRGKHEISYTQYWDGDAYKVQTKGRTTTGYINGKEIFRVTNGVRIVTDWQGTVEKIINIKDKALNIDFTIAGKKKTIILKPNQVYMIKKAIYE